MGQMIESVENPEQRDAKLLLDVMQADLNVHLSALQQIQSAAAIILGFSLAATAELLGFLLLLSAEHPLESQIMRSVPLSYRTPAAYVFVGMLLVGYAGVFSVLVLASPLRHPSTRVLVLGIFGTDEQVRDAFNRTERDISRFARRVDQRRSHLRLAIFLALAGVGCWIVAVIGFLAQHFPL
jgi:hypothetical protein